MHRAQLSIWLLCVVLSGAAHAQETDVDAAAVDAPADVDEQAAERDALEPGVSANVLAGVRRTYTGTDGVMDEIDLERTEVTGNQELPKVLYIVPWQKSDPGDLTGKPVNTLLDEVLAPIDRSEFMRQVDYYHDVNGAELDDQ